MSKHDELFRPEDVDEQIELLSRSPIEETLPSSDAHLISHLRQAYEDTEIAEQVWARLAQQIAGGRDKGVEQPEIDSQFPTIRQKNLKEGPRLMKAVSTEKRSKGSHIRLLETLVAVLILAIVLGILVTFKMKQPATGHAGPPTSATSTVRDQTGLYIATLEGVDRVSLQTGKIIWHIAKADADKPVVMGGMVFFTFADQGSAYLEAVDAVTGKQVWRKKDVLGNILTGANGTLIESTCPPDHKIGQNCFVYAIKASNGKLLWSYATDFAFIAVQGGRIYGTTLTGGIFALSAAIGTVIWQKTLPNQTVAHMKPLVNDNVMYFSACDNANLCYPYAFNAINGTELWQKTIGVESDLPPVFLDGVVYYGAVDGDVYTPDGSIYALNAQTGATLWKYHTGGVLPLPLIGAQGIIYIEQGASDNTESLVALKATDKSILWSKKLGYTNYGIVSATGEGLIAAIVNMTNIEVFHIHDGTTTIRYKGTTKQIDGFTLITQNG